MTAKPISSNRSRRGTATVEFALVTPLLLLLLAAVVDFGMLLRTATCLTDAARAGAEYGSQNATTSQDIAGMKTAAANAEPGISGMTTTAVQSCQCSNGSTVSCGGSCGSGAVQIYVKVTTTATTAAAFTNSSLGYNGTISAAATLRAQ